MRNVCTNFHSPDGAPVRGAQSMVDGMHTYLRSTSMNSQLLRVLSYNQFVSWHQEHKYQSRLGFWLWSTSFDALKVYVALQ